MLCANISFLCALAAVLIVASALGAQTAADLPAGAAPKPVETPHFPDRLHAFIWRNWSLVDPPRLAKVLDTSVENVQAVAESLGLPAARPVPPEQEARGYITVIRRNWHLLPYDQLLVLLGMSADQLAYTLREDDFLFIKLGLLKPACPPLRYTPPTAEARQRAGEIKQLVQETFGGELLEPGEPRFGFIQEFSRPPALPPPLAGGGRGRASGELRFIYSYFALYGDPLANPNLDPYPDGLLARLAELGVNGIWMHTVLSTLAPSETFPEFGAGHEARLANLRKLVERAKRYGISIYLYMNEPRAMPAAFFGSAGVSPALAGGTPALPGAGGTPALPGTPAARAEMRGVHEGDHYTLCTSAPQVREWLSGALAFVFKNVPGLGGVFTITASENLTNCASHGRHKDCPRCGKRTPAEIIAEVNTAIEQGVHRGNPEAKVIVWDWGWGDFAGEAIAKLPKSVWFQSVSEWDKPIERGGVKSTVGEYSISAVGPGPRATRHWALARQAGLKTVAKVQMNNTWELSAVPYLPVLDLIAEHCQGLASAGVDGLMLSWSLGGYPSPNLEVARAFAQRPAPAPEAVLDTIARERFGAEGAADARRAWTTFSNAFREFPFNIGVLYSAPQQCGPANLLYASPSGYHATMVGIPYDDLNTWRGPYPAAVLAEQFAKVASGWQEGLPHLQRAVEKAPPDWAAGAQAELRFAEAAQLHFRSVANQVRFTAARNALLAKDKPLDAEQRKARIEEMRQAALDEIVAARRLFTLARLDSRIGYEASNHYYYVPLDLVEKVINCRYILGQPPLQ